MDELLKILKNALEGIELTEEETRFLKWISGWDRWTVQRFAQIIKKCRNLYNPVKWIPVEGRLPEEDTVYLVTMVTPGYFNGQIRMEMQFRNRIQSLHGCQLLGHISRTIRI